MKELVVAENQSLVGIEDYAMSISGVLKQVKLIQQVQKEVMKQDEHYGVIPGTKKNTLYKSGAEKLCMVFRLSPGYDFISSVRELSFISYTVKCTLTHIQTGQIISTGIGSCNSREDKYRFTHKDELTDKPVPKTYWDARNSGDNKTALRIIGGPGYRTAKNDAGQWVIAKSEKVENDNAFNLDNTITKMACKRALIAATLNATAASDIFTQDLDDITVKQGVVDEQQAPDFSKKSPEFKELSEAKNMFPEEYKQAIAHFRAEPQNIEQYKQVKAYIDSLVDQAAGE